MVRNYKIDNIKALLIFLVVLGHIYENVTFQTIYFQRQFIYSFHMPAFVLISGLCFKNKRCIDIFKSYIYPYIILQLAYCLPIFYKVNGENFTIQLTKPHWTLWFLLSLGLWTLFSKILSSNKFILIISVIISMIIALLVGYCDEINSFLSLSRTIVYYPFFLLGILIKTHYNEVLTSVINNKTKIIFIILGFVSVYLLYLNRSLFLVENFYNSVSYLVGGTTINTRIYNFILALIFISFLIVIINNVKYKLITNIGQNTLSVYIVHALIVSLTPIDILLELLPFKIISVPLFSFLLVYVLSTRYISNTIHYILYLPFNLYKKS